MLLLTLAACIENSLSTDKTDNVAFDTGDTAPPFQTDTADTDSGESGGGTETGELIQCDPEAFSGYALSINDNCTGASPVHPDWVLEEHWEDGTMGWSISSPVMVNLTDDNGNGRIDDNDTPDVIFAPYTGGVYALDGSDGHRIWSTGSSLIEQSTPAVGDIDGDGFPEVFVQGLYGSMLLSGEDGSTIWTGRAANNIKTYCGAPGIADFDGDGDIELYFGNMILNAADDGVIMAGSGGQGTSIPGEGPISVAADIDLDGQLDLVAGNTVYEMDGSVMWNNPSEPDGFPAVADFDTDPEAEVLVSSNGVVNLFDTDGSKMWTYHLPAGGYGGPPAVADVDGDGDPEAIIPYQSGISVLSKSGTELWTYTHGTGTLYDGVSAYDFDGNGTWEVVLNTPTEVILFNGADGTILSRFPNGGLYSCGQEPTMADIDNDGHAEIAFTFGSTYGGPGGVGVLGDTSGFAAALSVWNQHQFSITNVENDGEIPAYPDPNWEHINNFRAGPPIQYVTQSQNLVGNIRDICVDECAQGNVTVWWSLGNNGSSEITDDIIVDIYAVGPSGDTLLGSELWTEDLPAGWMGTAMQNEYTSVPQPVLDIRMEVDGGTNVDLSMLSECDETDNVLEWGVPVCL